MFRGIKIYINYQEHKSPHFHAQYGEYQCSITINEIELLNGEMPNKQLKMLFGWAFIYIIQFYQWTVIKLGTVRLNKIYDNYSVQQE